MTLDRMAQDGIQLSEFLRKHLGKDRIILVAHSFGSIVALRMVQARPDLFYAYVGTGQVAGYQERSAWMVWLKVDPRFDVLRSDPRFQDLLRRVGLS